MNSKNDRLGLSPRWLALFVSLALGACIERKAGITLSGAGDSGEAGAEAEASGDGGGSGGSASGSGGSGGSGAESSEPSAQAGTSSGATAGSGGSGGVDESGGAPSAMGGEGGAVSVPNEPVAIPEACAYHTAAPPSGEGGAPTAPTITLQNSPFVGSYLADGAGRTLYVYGSDLPGDCRVDNAPLSRCEADCLIAWPVFDAGPRVLGPGLSDEGFGSIQRADGTPQTTYFGWPLYYYKSDLTLGQVSGQGKGKTWQIAEVTPSSIVIMKDGAMKYLADGAGRTLYVSSADHVGDAVRDPESACADECLQTFEPFHQKHPTPVPVLEPQDFSVFLAKSGNLQLSFRGQPLYRARTDQKAGDMTGAATPGYTAAALP